MAADVAIGASVSLGGSTRGPWWTDSLGSSFLYTGGGYAVAQQPIGCLEFYQTRI